MSLSNHDWETMAGILRERERVRHKDREGERADNKNHGQPN
jgi:hypothetical protein